MAIGRITYEDKIDSSVNQQDPKYKITAQDMNEIKQVFNESAEDIEFATENLGDYKVENGIIYFKKADGSYNEQGISLAGQSTILDGNGNVILSGYITPNDNLLINSCFKVWQRGDSVSPTQAKKITADRWRVRGDVDGTVTYAKYETSNGMKITTTSKPNSQVEQIIRLDKRIINSLVTRGVTSQLRYNRAGTGDSGNTTLTISILNSSQGVLFSQKASSKSTGASNPKTLVVTITPEEILQYEDSMTYICFNVSNSSMTTNTIITLHWCKTEYGIYPTPYCPKTFSQELLECEEYYAIRGINIRLDMSSSEFYRYSVPCDFMLDKNPTITIIGNTGDIKTSETNVSKTNSVRLINYEFVASSVGNRKQVTITAAFDGEIY